jgi:hypothetical protein
MVMAGMLAVAAQLEAQVQEYRAKAACLYNFAKFVEWPEQSFKNTETSVQICVMGPNPFGSFLTDALRGQMMDSRRFEVSQVTPADIGKCHILYVSPGGGKQFRSISHWASEAPMLTVGESDDFEGIITLRVVDERIQMEVNVGLASRARLRISSKLLKIATVVGAGGR